MLSVDEIENVSVLRIEHGKVNALDIDLLRALTDALAALAASSASSAEAVVVTGTRRVFSAGADLIRVLNEKASYVESSLPVLSAAFRAFFEFPKPLVAAVNGHAIAGGCILVGACDYRVMARGSGLIGVPELRVGVPFPVAALEILRFAAGARNLQELVYLGDNYTPEEGMRRGLIDEIVEPDDLLPHCIEVAARLARIPAETFAHTKRMVRRPVVERIRDWGPEMDPNAVRLWSSPEVLVSIERFLAEVLGAGRA